MIKVGEKITYIKCIENGSKMRFTEKKGVMVEWGKKLSKIRSRNGSIMLIETTSIRLASKQNALTEALLKFKLGDKNET